MIERETVIVNPLGMAPIFLRLTAAKVQAVSNISQQFGVETAGKPLANTFPETVSWCCPASP